MSDDVQNADEPRVAEEVDAEQPLTPPEATEPEPEATEPEATEPEPEPEATEPEPCSVSWVPFSAYLGLWVVLAVATFVVLRTPAAAGGALWAPEYALSVYGGVTLVAFGPVLALVVWLFARQSLAPECRRGLLTSSLLRSAGATFVGVVLWLVALYALDLYRLSLHA